MNRRLDEWVTRERIMDSSYDGTDQEPGVGVELGEGTDRKITRNALSLLADLRPFL